MHIRGGTLVRGDITWSPGHRIAPAYIDRSTEDFCGYYPDIVIDEDGFLSMSLRHHHSFGKEQRHGPGIRDIDSPQ